MALETNQITLAVVSININNDFMVVLGHLRRNCIVKNDVHVPVMDFVDCPSPCLNGAEMLV